MEKKKFLRHLMGYSVGILIFGIMIPIALVRFSLRNDLFIKMNLIDSDFLRSIIALPFLIIGLFFMVWSNIALFNIGKGGPADGFNITISPRTEKLVIKGPYRYTRNPMVFGAYLTYFSIGIYFNSFDCLALLIIFFFMTIFYLKKIEEKRLYKDFGNDFLEYKRSVSMIILFRKKQNHK
jgi:protein-S-isoprenylcysteine O-methyltransferase Ste14